MGPGGFGNSLFQSQMENQKNSNLAQSAHVMLKTKTTAKEEKLPQTKPVDAKKQKDRIEQEMILDVVERACSNAKMTHLTLSDQNDRSWLDSASQIK